MALWHLKWTLPICVLKFYEMDEQMLGSKQEL